MKAQTVTAMANNAIVWGVSSTEIAIVIAETWPRARIWILVEAAWTAACIKDSTRYISMDPPHPTRAPTHHRSLLPPVCEDNRDSPSHRSVLGRVNAASPRRASHHPLCPSAAGLVCQIPRQRSLLKVLPGHSQTVPFQKKSDEARTAASPVHIIRPGRTALRHHRFAVASSPMTRIYPWGNVGSQNMVTAYLRKSTKGELT